MATSSARDSGRSARIPCDNPTAIPAVSMVDFFSTDAFQSSPNLPSDVLRDVFEFYIDNYHHDRSRPLSPKDVPWFLGHVCRLWRAAAIATPQLWNRFPPLKLTVEKQSCHPMFDELLTRSGVRPIRVHLNFALNKGDAGPETYPALEPLIAASKRWEEVIIRGLNVQHMEYQFRKIEGQIPHLRRVLLSFGRDASDVDQVAGPTSIFRDAPVLSELLVHRLSLSVWQRFPVISWKQLTRYEDAKGSCGGPYEILKRAENLETFITMDCNFQEPDQSLLVHSKLCQFQAHVTRTQVSFLALLDKLKLPNLRNLAVTFDPLSTAPEFHAAPTLTSLLTRSQCNLQTLVLNQGPLHDFEVSEMLAATPRLETLELGDCANLDRVLLSLVFKKMENTLLPYLRNLTFVFPGTLRHRHIKAILHITESRNKQVIAEDELSLGCLFVPLQNVRITVHEFAFRFKACLDLNKKFSGNDIEAPMSAVEQQVSKSMTRVCFND